MFPGKSSRNVCTPRVQKTGDSSRGYQPTPPAMRDQQSRLNVSMGSGPVSHALSLFKHVTVATEPAVMMQRISTLLDRLTAQDGDPASLVTRLTRADTHSGAEYQRSRIFPQMFALVASIPSTVIPGVLVPSCAMLGADAAFNPCLNVFTCSAPFLCLDFDLASTVFSLS